MTEEEVLNNFEIKTILKVLRMEYPFIKGLKLDGGYNDYTHSAFFEVLIDPNELSEFVGMKFRKYMVGEKGELINFLRSIVGTTEDKERMNELQKEVEKIFEEVHESKTIPYTMKLDKFPRGVSFRTTSPYQS